MLTVPGWVAVAQKGDDPSAGKDEEPGTGGDEEEPASDRANLAVDSVSYQPLQPVEDDEVRFTVSIENKGRGASASFLVRFFVDGILIDEQTAAGVGGTAKGSVTSDPWTAVLGEHSLSIVLDADNTINEFDETDNSYEGPLLVNGAFQGIELAAVDLTWTPASPQSGASVTFKALVRNRGLTQATNILVEFFVDTTKLSEETLATLGPQSEAFVESDAWTATRGNHTVRAKVDANARLTEPDETNNEIAKPLPVLPDLVVATLVPDDKDIQPGDSVVFTARIRNQGNAATSDAIVPLNGEDEFVLRFYAGTTILSEVTLRKLAPGGEATGASAAWSATAGAHTVTAVVDAIGEVAESQESNNRLPLTLKVGPDLDIVDVTITPPNPREGDAVRISAKVSNVGTQATGAFTVRFAPVGAAAIGERTSTGLAKGATATFQSNDWSVAQGEYAFIVTADAGAQVAEADEANNAHEDVVFVRAPPTPADLTVVEFKPSAAEATAGQSVTFDAIIKNEGQVPAGSFAVRFEIAGTELSTHDIARLGSGERVTVRSSEWAAAGASVIARVTLDAFEDVDEADEDDNAATTKIQVAKQQPAFGVLGIVAALGVATIVGRRRA